jgi:hypothetical protein
MYDTQERTTLVWRPWQLRRAPARPPPLKYAMMVESSVNCQGYYTHLEMYSELVLSLGHVVVELVDALFGPAKQEVEHAELQQRRIETHGFRFQLS